MSATIALNIDTFLPFMRDASRTEASLRELNLMWRLIEASAKMNCPSESQHILGMMSVTRRGIQRLEHELVASLVQETVFGVMAEIGTQAEHLIDIVVRNLYERTADVGFLAMDRELCRYLQSQPTDDDRERITHRLREYRNKYTVYDDILLLNPDGQVMAQIDDSAPVAHSTDPLLADTLAADSFVETFRHSDLRPGQPLSLIYSRRITGAGGQVLGVLCLSFGFTGEMTGIFEARSGHDSRAIMLLLDGNDRVAATSDADWIPTGTKVPTNPSRAEQLFVHAGRAYLVATADPKGYQGYPGPDGWRGQVMTPVDLAFASKGKRNIDRLDPAVAQGLLTHAQSFSPPLYEIVTAAETIRRVVWNGQVMSASWDGELQNLKLVLEQISETGVRTNQVFSRRIRDLYDTVLTASMREGEFLTHLLVDLLDRNLYERADDCRWWALTPELRAILAQTHVSADDARQLSAILESIHHLYTVYSQLVVYDRFGVIVAATQPHHDDGSNVVGSRIEEDTLAAVLSLRDSQSYHVTPFRPSPLFGGKHTYIYHAGIRAEGGSEATVGGIGIVFHAEREFADMLTGGMGEMPDTRAIYVRRNGLIISSTDPTRPAGSTLKGHEELLALPRGEATSRVLVHDGSYTIVGCAASSGYREFKVSDGYTEDVLAMSFRTYGAEVPGADDMARRLGTLISEGSTVSGGREVATFYVNASLFGMPAEAVLQALPASALSNMTSGGLNHCVGAVPRMQGNKVKGYVWAFDLGQLFFGTPTVINYNSQVLVVRSEDREFGLLVSDLQGVPAFPASAIMKLNNSPNGPRRLVSHVVQANEGKLLIQLLDCQCLLNVLLPDDALDPSRPVVDSTVSAY